MIVFYTHHLHKEVLFPDNKSLLNDKSPNITQLFNNFYKLQSKEQSKVLNFNHVQLKLPKYNHENNQKFHKVYNQSSKCLLS